MADDTLEIIEPLDFHPCDTPRGCKYYNLRMLTPCQQTKLNAFKRMIVKNDEKYLRCHPEIRGFVMLIIRYVLKQQPRRQLPLVIKEFFDRPHSVIEEELEQYLQTLPQDEPDVCQEEEEESQSHSEKDIDEYILMLGKDTSSTEHESKLQERGIDVTSTEVFIRQLLDDTVAGFTSPVPSELVHSLEEESSRPSTVSSRTNEKLSQTRNETSGQSISQSMPPATYKSLISIVPRAESERTVIRRAQMERVSDMYNASNSQQMIIPEPECEAEEEFENEVKITEEQENNVSEEGN